MGRIKQLKLVLVGMAVISYAIDLAVECLLFPGPLSIVASQINMEGARNPAWRDQHKSLLFSSSSSLYNTKFIENRVLGAETSDRAGSEY